VLACPTPSRKHSTNQPEPVNDSETPSRVVY
jgi:hypothetical protein